MAYTVIFSGSVRDFARNPYRTESAFGTVCGLADTDLFLENERLGERIEVLEAALREIADLGVLWKDPGDGEWCDVSKIARAALKD